MRSFTCYVFDSMYIYTDCRPVRCLNARGSFFLKWGRTILSWLQLAFIWEGEAEAWNRGVACKLKGGIVLGPTVQGSSRLPHYGSVFGCLAPRPPIFFGGNRIVLIRCLHSPGSVAALSEGKAQKLTLTTKNLQNLTLLASKLDHGLLKSYSLSYLLQACAV